MRDILGYNIKHIIAEQHPRGKEVERIAREREVSASTVYRAIKEGNIISKVVSGEAEKRSSLLQQGVLTSPIFHYNDIL